MFTLLNKQDKNKIPLLIILAVVKYYSIRQYRKIPYKISFLSRNIYITELLTHNHLRYIQEMMQIFLSTLHQLKSFCISFTKLQNLRKIILLEKIVIFIYILRHDALNWEVQEYFQHSELTFSFCFQEVLAAMLILYIKYIYQSKFLDSTFDTILQNQKYSLYFDNNISILNGIYIAIHVPIKKYKLYPNRNSYLL